MTGTAASPRARQGAASEPGLGERLVQVTLELLAEQGLEDLSLRRIARRAGVSHGAPARHFRSHADLLAEVAARGFALLSEALRKCDAQLPSDASPQRQLAAAARAYLDCALANPALFALMFRPESLDPSNASFARDSRDAFEALLQRVRSAQRAGWHPHTDTRLLAGSTWASLHGLATLWAQGAYQGPIPGVSLDDALSTTLELIGDDRQGDPA
jgi:AcrR family transcriptional regulator